MIAKFEEKQHVRIIIAKLHRNHLDAGDHKLDLSNGR